MDTNGSSPERPDELSDYLQQISSKSLLPTSFWPKFFAVDELRVIDLANPMHVEAVSLIIVNGVNLPPLLEAASDLISRVNTQTNRGKCSISDVAQATAALRFVYLTFHLATVNYKPDMVAAAFAVGPRVGDGELSTSGLRKLVDATLTLVANPSSLSTPTYDLILEGVNFFLVLLSDQLYTVFQSSKVERQACVEAELERDRLAVVESRAKQAAAQQQGSTGTQLEEVENPQPPATFVSWLGFGAGQQQPPAAVTHETIPSETSTTNATPAPPVTSKPCTPPRRYLGLELVMESMEPSTRQRQASDLIKTILKWIIHRPDAPPMASSPATARAVGSQAIMHHRLQQQARAQASNGKTLNAGSPMNLAEAHRQLTSSISSIASAVLYLPLLPFLRMYSFLFVNSTQPRLAAHQPPSPGTLSRTESSVLTSPLADRGLILLCLLTHNYRDDRIANPFHKALSQLYDPRYSGVLESGDSMDDMVEAGKGGGLLAGDGQAVAPSTSFESLLESIGKLLNDDDLSEPAAFLLYTLMQSSAAFKEITMSRSDLEFIVLPLLKSLYNAPKARSPPTLYIIAILLLSFTQDEGFNVTVFQHLFVQKVPWYQERYLRNMSVGSLIVLCVLRTLVYTLSKLNDIYLLENCLAILSNMSPHMEHIHSYAAQRVVAVSITVLKKYTATVEELRSSQTVLHASDSAVLQASSSQDERVEELQQSVYVYARCAEAIIKALNACLRTRQIGKNATIVYALMHRHIEVEDVIGHELISTNYPIGPIRHLLNFLADRIKESPERELSVEKTSEIIERGVAAYTANAHEATDSLDVDVPLKIAHEEPEDPEAFFVPYAWAVTQVHTSDLGWNTGKVDPSMTI